MPNTFLKPMEASIDATRMMAMYPQGQRPTWSDLSYEIDPKGNLVQVAPRNEGQLGNPLNNPKLIADANFYESPFELTSADLGKKVSKR